MDHQAFGVSHVGQMREQLERLNEPVAGFEPASNAECHDGARATRQIFLR